MEYVEKDEKSLQSIFYDHFNNTKMNWLHAVRVKILGYIMLVWKLLSSSQCLAQGACGSEEQF